MKIIKNFFSFKLLVIFVILMLTAGISTYSIDKSNDKKIVYLTFDDGPIPIITDKILNVLKDEKIKATFFVVGKEIPGREEILKRINADGHTIGLHTYSHKFNKVYSSDKAFVDEMLKVRQQTFELLHINPSAIRFPGGSSGRLSKSLLKQLYQNDMKVFDWNLNLYDGYSIRKSVKQIIKNGKRLNPKYIRLIILAHCNSNNINTAKALPEIIRYYKAKGYEFKAIEKNTHDYFYKIVK